jgi:hypothetical protein
MAGNTDTDTNTAQVVDSALCEVIAGALEFELGKPRRLFLSSAEAQNEEIDGEFESSTDPDISAAARQVETP